MSPEEFSKEVIEVTNKSSKIDWESFSDQQRDAVMVMFQLVGHDLNIMSSLGAVKRAFLRHAFLMTVGVLGALLLNIDSTKIALACCVLTALSSAWVSVVLWSFSHAATETLNSLKSFVDARASRGEKE